MHAACTNNPSLVDYLATRIASDFSSAVSARGPEFARACLRFSMLLKGGKINPVFGFVGFVADSRVSDSEGGFADTLSHGIVAIVSKIRFCSSDSQRPHRERGSYPQNGRDWCSHCLAWSMEDQ